MHEERSTLIIHLPGLPYVPSGCPRPWKEAVRAALHLLDSEESALRIGSRHPTFTEDGGSRGQEPWRQTWVFPSGWPGLWQLPSLATLLFSNLCTAQANAQLENQMGASVRPRTNSSMWTLLPSLRFPPPHNHLLKTPVPDQDAGTVTISLLS